MRSNLLTRTVRFWNREWLALLARVLASFATLALAAGCGPGTGDETPFPQYEVERHPQSLTVTEGSSASFDVVVWSYNPGLMVFYHWQRSNNSGATWVEIPGANSFRYTLDSARLGDAALGGDNGALFRVSIYDGNTHTDSEAAKLTVTASPPSAPTFGLAPVAPAMSVMQGSSGEVAVDIARNAGFAGVPITLGAESANSGIQVGFAPNPASADSALATVSVALTTPPGTYDVRILGTGTPAGGSEVLRGTHLLVTVTGLPPPPPPPAGDFSITPRSASLTLPQGEITAVDIDINRTLGFSDLVSFSASAVPRGTNARFDPPGPTGGNAKRLILVAGPTADLRTSAMTVTATSSSGLSRTAQVSVTVMPGQASCQNEPIADAYIGPSITNGAGGISQVLRVGTGLFEQAAKTYLAFDVRAATDAAFDKVEFVISLYSNPWAVAQPDSTRTVYVWGVTDNNDWKPVILSEVGIDWGNAPKNDTTSQYDFLGEGTTSSDATRFVGSLVVWSADVTRKRYRVDVTQYVRWALDPNTGYSSLAAIDADGILTFMLGNNLLFGGKLDNYTEFFSREAPDACDRPHLEVFR